MAQRSATCSEIKIPLNQARSITLMIAGNCMCRDYRPLSVNASSWQSTDGIRAFSESPASLDYTQWLHGPASSRRSDVVRILVSLHGPHRPGRPPQQAASRIYTVRIARFSALHLSLPLFITQPRAVSPRGPSISTLRVDYICANTGVIPLPPPPPLLLLSLRMTGVPLLKTN